MKKDKNMKNKVMELIYSNKTLGAIEIIKAYAGLIPIPGWNTVLAGTTGIINDKLSEKRIRYYIDKLNNEEINMDEIQANASSLWNMIQTINVVMRTKRKEKIDCFVNILVNGYNEKMIFNDDDVFEDYIKILERLSMEDIIILEVLRKENIIIADKDKEKLNNFETALENKLTAISEKSNMNRDYTIAMLDKLVGYGLCTKTMYQNFGYGIGLIHNDYNISPIYENLSNLMTKKQSVKKCF